MPADPQRRAVITDPTRTDVRRSRRWARAAIIAAMMYAVSWHGAKESSLAAERDQSTPSAAIAGQTSDRTIWTGVYSTEQAKRGEVAAGRSCTKCHNADLTGGQDGPGLVGPEVVQAWSVLTVGDLFERIRTTMPADAPLSLSPQETADILAYVLSLNKCPPGEAELPSDRRALDQIRITNRP